MMKDHNYFIYIVTNLTKTTLYIGVTNDLDTRLKQHYDNRGNPETFAGKYHCHNLVYWELFQYIDHAIDREKELKKWNRSKKNKLIEEFNSDWRFLNEEVIEKLFLKYCHLDEGDILNIIA